MRTTFLTIFQQIAFKTTLLAAILLLGALISPASASNIKTDAGMLQLQKQFAEQQKSIMALERIVAQQQDRIAKLEAVRVSTPHATSTFGPFVVSGTDVYLTGYNLHIQSGSGATNATTNGLGNLIVGYNATRGGAGDKRTGSHNIILGDKQNYFGYGGFVCGSTNTLKGPYSCIFGGQYNAAVGNQSVVVGGYQNTAATTNSVVEGGSNLTTTTTNDLQPYLATVPGLLTKVTNLQTSVASLNTSVTTSNKITNLFSLSDGVGTATELTLTGVNLHIVNGLGASDGNPGDPFDENNDAVTNGLGNLIVGYNESSSNTRNGSHNLVLGIYNSYTGWGGLIAGAANEIDGGWSCVNGGDGNQADGEFSVVSGGHYNTSSSLCSTVSGGINDQATAYYSTSSGGESQDEGSYGGLDRGGLSYAVGLQRFRFIRLFETLSWTVRPL